MSDGDIMLPTPVINPGVRPIDEDFVNAYTAASRRMAEAITARYTIKIAGDDTETKAKSSEQIKHDTENANQLLKFALDEALLPLPSLARTPDGLVKAMRDFFEPPEKYARQDAARLIEQKSGPDKETERRLHATKQADRKLAMLFLAATLGVDRQWMTSYREIDEQLKASGKAA